MTRERAETIGLQALTWLVANEELLPVFLGATGASETDLKTRAADPEFLIAVLDFILMDEAWVLALCDAQSLDYSDPQMSRAVLPGGEAYHWT